EWREHLLVDLLLAPALGAAEVVVGLLAIDPRHQLLAHMLVRRAERMPGLVPDDALELGLRGAHRERLQVHGRPVLRDQQNVGPEIGPIAARSARDAYLAGALGLGERDAAGPGPGI